MDDILIASNDIESVNIFKAFLDHKFKLKDLGSLKYFLGFEVARNKTGISISQRKYALEILSDTRFLVPNLLKPPWNNILSSLRMLVLLYKILHPIEDWWEDCFILPSLDQTSPLQSIL